MLSTCVDATFDFASVADFEMHLKKSFYFGQPNEPRYVVVSYKTRDLIRSEGDPEKWSGPVFHKESKYMDRFIYGMDK